MPRAPHLEAMTARVLETRVHQRSTAMMARTPYRKLRLAPFSPHDQPIVWELHGRFIDQALNLIEARAGDADADSRFHFIT